MKNSRSFGEKRCMPESLKRFFFMVEDRWFDLVNHIDTGGIVKSHALDTNSPFKSHATDYHPTWSRTVRLLLQKSRQLGFRPGVFLDVGCGKGKACFYAARFAGGGI